MSNNTERKYISPDTAGKLLPPQRVFTPDKIQNVWNLLPVGDLVAAMCSANPQMTTETAQAVLGGEFGRLMLLGYYHEQFYNKPLSILRDRGIVTEDYKVNELGPSLMLHYAMLSGKSPISVNGIENRPHIVAASECAIKTLQEAGLLPSNCKVVLGDHFMRLVPADISLMSLVTQYGAGEGGSLQWLMENGVIGVNGDVYHTATPTSDAELDNGILHIKSLTNPDLNTGFAWKLISDGEFTPFGTVYRAEMVIDQEVFDGKRVGFTPFEGDTYHGEVLVYRTDEGLKFHSWSLKPTDSASDSEVHEVVALHRSLYDIYRGVSRLSGGDIWDSAGAFALPAYAKKEGYFTNVMLTTANNAGLSGRIPLAIILKNTSEAAQLTRLGLMSQVGEGKIFPNLPTLIEKARHWLNPQNGFDQKFKLSHSPLVTTITSSSMDATAI